VTVSLILLRCKELLVQVWYRIESTVEATKLHQEDGRKLGDQYQEKAEGVCSQSTIARLEALCPRKASIALKNASLSHIRWVS
jgi:hypothetical protein